VIGNLSLLFSLLWQPMTAIKQLRERAPVALAVGAAWVASALYAFVPAFLMRFTAVSRAPSLEDGEMAMGALTGGLYSAVTVGLMSVLFMAAIYVPFAIFIANLFERRASFSLVIREEYAATAACALSAWAMSLLVTLLPAVIIGWQSVRLTG
jgi:hypothetical protein